MNPSAHSALLAVPDATPAKLTPELQATYDAFVARRSAPPRRRIIQAVLPRLSLKTRNKYLARLCCVRGVKTAAALHSRLKKAA
jgi:hypothetical protein